MVLVPAFLSPAAISVTCLSKAIPEAMPDGKFRPDRSSNDLERQRCWTLATHVSILHFDINRVDRQESRREQLLALFSLRRGVESGSSHKPASTAVATMMPTATTPESSRAQTLRQLRELMAALDRRVPQLERVGEVAIARAAAVLKSEALKRIEELT